MSGGQMQRVAIARALVNDPDILLADEPTGALDSETSVQIMEILREISADKLIIMVTHNPELAEEYSEWNVDAEKGVYSTAGEKLWAIEKAALALENWQYSGVVRSTEGHHIIMRLPIDEGYVNTHIGDLELASFTRRYHEYISAQGEKAEVKYNKYYDTLTHEMLTAYTEK